MELDSNTTLVLIIIGVVATLCLAGFLTWLILRKAPCLGPETLDQGDANALATFQELYKLGEIAPQLPEEYFQVVKKSWMRVRDYIELETPITHWPEMFEGQVSGFLVVSARKINGVLHDYQLRMWEKHGDFIEHWPVMLVAQEWRMWAMGFLQGLERPTQDARTDVLARLRWIESARNLRVSEVANLRCTRGWDDNKNESLLVALRDWVRPELDEVVDRWDSYELQITFGEQLRSLKVLLEQNVASSLRFVEVILDTEDVRLTSCFWGGKFCETPAGHHDPYLDALSKRIQQLLKNTAEPLTDLAPGGGDAPKPPPGAPKPPDSLDKEEQAQWRRQMQMRKACDYGISEADLQEVLTGYVIMHRAVEAVAHAVVLIRRLSRFAQLGGELFLARSLNKDHLLELLDFVQSSLRKSGECVEYVADTTQRGWETIRRGSKSTSWSSRGPLDNLRVALSAKADILKTVREGVGIARELAAKADRSAAQKVTDDVNAELEAYLAEWEAVKKEYSQVEDLSPAAIAAQREGDDSRV